MSGYVSYLAACEMNEAFSEYVLYEPILRILTARGYSVEFEVICPGVRQPATGDRRRLDLVATRQTLQFAMEVKWAKEGTLDVTNDYDKLTAFLGCRSSPENRTYAYLCVFGHKSHIRNLELTPTSFQELDRAVIAEFGKTRYGCRIFEVDACATIDPTRGSYSVLSQNSKT